MIDNETKIKLEDLNLDLLLTLDNRTLVIQKNNVSYHFKFHSKVNSNNLVVFSNGALNRNKKDAPFFSRFTWAREFNANSLYIDDPTIHDSHLTVGWGVGEKDNYYLKEISEIIDKITKLLNIKNNNIIFFGSSAGGFMSIMLSIFKKRSLAIANNPQIWIRKDTQKNRAENLYNSAFPNMSEKEIAENYGDRLSVLKMMEEYNYIPNIVYVLNRYSNKDFKEQYLPFVEYIDNIDNTNDSIELLLYHSDKGHGGIYPRAKTIQLINKYLDLRNPSYNFNTKKFNTFKMYDNNNNYIESMRVNDNTLYLPVKYLKKDFSCVLEKRFESKKGTLKIELINKYLNAKGSGYLQYEIVKNSKTILIEDISKWPFQNQIYLHNLQQNDIILIRIRTLKNCEANSWSKASRTEILNIVELTKSIEYNSPASFSSPYSVQTQE
ncbi:hypothetical protein [Corticicoccus populi]|uniref:Uncharacterized protein n=1 Tax=Corticicoccus populi TaxID=1812821 RepID=A0ABW5WX59_9STAP